MTSAHLLVFAVWALLGLAAVRVGGCSNRALEPRLRDQRLALIATPRPLPLDGATASATDEWRSSDPGSGACLR
jgi:hypothetical protein